MTASLIPPGVPHPAAGGATSAAQPAPAAAAHSAMPAGAGLPTPAGTSAHDLAPAGNKPRRNKPRQIGTFAETAVVRHLAANGFPNAERRSLKGTYDQGDVTGTPGVCWEVKGGHAAENASDGQIAAWLVETETERVNAGADVGVLVVKRKGISAVNAGRWWAVLPLTTLTVRWDVHLHAAPVRLHLADAVRLLRSAGYGAEIEDGAA